jgi:8-oxo-dGTP diphosphatase
MRVPASLPQVCVCYLLRRSEAGASVLLGRKKKGLGVGKIVAPGGKLEAGETTTDAAVREIAEESGLIVQPGDLVQRGLLTYLFPTRQEWSQESSVFICERFAGEPVDSDELDLEWFPIEQIPLDRMWDDARFWLPDLLGGARVRRTFTFAADLSSVLPGDTTPPVAGAGAGV